MKKNRLNQIISLIRDNVRIADVGCDHAYITTEALRSGKATFSVASDIRPGPLSRANDNIKIAGLDGKVKLLLTDGLDGVEEYKPDDVIIAGLGGEVTARIIGDAPFLKNGNISIIMQPMTCAEKLRAYLAENGFEIVRELIAKESVRTYQIINAVYTGKPYELSELELLIGPYNLRSYEDPKIYRVFIEKNINKLEKIAAGKRSSGADPSKEEELLEKLYKISAEVLK